MSAIPRDRGNGPQTGAHRFAYKSRRYLDYVEWIAYNDDSSMDPATVADYISVTMLAHVNNVKREAVAADVLHIRSQIPRD